MPSRSYTFVLLFKNTMPRRVSWYLWVFLHTIRQTFSMRFSFIFQKQSNLHNAIRVTCPWINMSTCDMRLRPTYMCVYMQDNHVIIHIVYYSLSKIWKIYYLIPPGSDINMNGYQTKVKLLINIVLQRLFPLIIFAKIDTI